MREEMLLESRPKSCKFSDQNVATRANGKTNINLLKMKSSSVWGSNLVKGFTTEKKNKPPSAMPSKKLPLTSSDISNQKNASVPHQTRVRRSIIGDLACSANSAQVHPHAFDSNRLKLPGTRDLFLELDHLRSLLRDYKERELKLQAELKDCKENPRISELEKELELKRRENEDLIQRVGFLEDEKTSLSERFTSLSSVVVGTGEASGEEENANATTDQSDGKSLRNLEMEVLELRRVNKELQFQKRNLACTLATAESQLVSLAKESQSDIVEKVEAEASILRHTNENLCKQVEGLQMSRLSEVEELVYLRWVNSCLRSELRNLAQASSDDSEVSSPKSQNVARLRCLEYLNIAQNSERGFNGPILSECTGFCSAKKVGLTKKLRKWSKADEDCQVLEGKKLLDYEWLQSPEGNCSRRRHSISGMKDSMEDLVPDRRRQSDGFICPSKETEHDAFGNANGSTVKGSHPQVSQTFDVGTVHSPRFFVGRHETNKIMAMDVEKRALRIPNPPPKPSSSILDAPKKDGAHLVQPPPPPPPPPPPKFSLRNTSVMQRAPQVVEFYHSLMKRESRKDSSGGGVCDAADVANVRSSMIGEIENRSSHLLAIKADVETQGEFVNSLIREVNGAVYNDIQDVVAFVKWLDDELCFLVDERAVLKHFDWPEKKADTLREAAFGYRDLKKLEAEISHYEDDPRLPCDSALKKMVALSEKMERSVYNILRTRDVLMRNCKEFRIPTDWMLDTGIISKIKFASVKLAKKYMKRVAMELQSRGTSDKDPTLEYMLLQGVRFAFRIHQFAGGFDAETMRAFEELRNLAHNRYKK